MIKKISCGVFVCCLAAMAASCSDDDDYIPPRVLPPAVEEPGGGDDEPGGDVFNNLGEGFTPHQDGAPYDTYMGLVMTGYQGWFGTPGDGSQMTKNDHEGWYHYRESNMFRPGVLKNSIDFWPDMSEYEKKYEIGQKFENKNGDMVDFNGSPFILPDGKYATVFSSYDESTVMLHFKWMKDYDIDGAFMQRFVGECYDWNKGAGVPNVEHKDHFDTVLKHAMKASNKYGRAIAIMYDMGGVVNDNAMRSMVQDAQELMDLYQLKNRDVQKFYLHENGKPMLTLWGVGLNDDDHPKPSFLKSYVEELQKQGWAIMLGCPAYWRKGGQDCVSGAEHKALIDLIKSCDAFMPWYVGRYGYDNFKSAEWQDRISEDIAEAKTYSTEGHRVVYSPHLFPGGSDRNMHPNNGYPTGDPTGTGYRYGGKFFWDQIYCDIKNGAQALYIGMFDEVDEGTAIFKQMNVKDVPNNTYYSPATVPASYDYSYENGGSDYWVNFFEDGHYSVTSKESTADKLVWSNTASSLNVKFQGIDNDKPTDFYLWMTGEARKMLNGQKKMSETIPER